LTTIFKECIIKYIVLVEMNSAIFRRGTRKGCGCTGGALNTQNMMLQQQKLNRFNKKIANMTKRRFHPRQIAAEQKLRNEQKALVNKLKAARNATASNAGIVSTIKNKVQNAVKAVTQQTNQVEQSIARTNNVIQNQPMAVQQAVTTANNAVVAANKVVNKAKQLAALANRVNTLANQATSLQKNIKSIVGGKRNRCTRRK
jgi:methyl-accepting chemotaxis protein